MMLDYVFVYYPLCDTDSGFVLGAREKEINKTRESEYGVALED